MKPLDIKDYVRGPWDPLKEWNWLASAVQGLEGSIYQQGMKLTKIVIAGRCHPHLTIESAGGPVTVEFPEYEEARNRVHGFR